MNDERYCPNCGAKQSSANKFCVQCGWQLSEIKSDEKQGIADQSRPHVAQSASETGSKSSGCFTWIFVMILIIVIALCVLKSVCPDLTIKSLGNALFNADSDTQLLTRTAENSDVLISVTLNANAIGMDLVITPQVDIDSLTFTAKYYSSDDELLKTQSIYIGNVVKGVPITRTISITDFSISEFVKIDYTRIGVSAGTVSYLK